jgi:CheY-like chemotaxis protein
LLTNAAVGQVTIADSRIKVSPPLAAGNHSTSLKIGDIPIRILAVDDAVLIRKFHSRMLLPTGADVVEAFDGADAVCKYYTALQEGRPFNGILMDSSMPNMDGTLATKFIRELGYKGKIFGITGNALKEDQDNFVSHGVDRVLSKPIDLEAYNEMLNEIIENVTGK